MVRVGVAGYGFAGRDIHAPVLREAGLDVVAISTGNPDRAAAARADFPAVDVVPSLEALLTRDDLDVVVLATPSGAHDAHARAVLDAGIACVVDKPLAVDAAQGYALVEYAAARGVPLTVFQNRRYDPEQATTLAVARDKAIGEVFRLELRWERWRPVPKDRWRENADPAEGGGILLDLHSHLIDMAVQVLGPVESVFASVDSRTTRAEDDAFLVTRHTSGARAHLGATSLSGAPGPRVRMLGTTGAYVVAQFEGEPTLYTEFAHADPDHCGWLVRGDVREPVPVVRSSQADFYRALGVALESGTSQRGMPVNPWESVHALSVIDAARVSAAEDRVVPVRSPQHD